MIPYGRQSVSNSDIEAVIEILRSDWLTQGPSVAHFERAVATRVGAKHAVAVNSATSALHIACLALDLGPGDRLWTSPNTFVATANCALYCGATVDFVDIDPSTYNISVDALAEKLAHAEKLGTLPKIVAPVHFAGHSCDMARIHQLASRYGFKIIEDASHAIGGRYGDMPVGDCAYSHIAVFSFHPVKIITSAEGGMALTNDASLAERMHRLRTHGITRDPDQLQGPCEGPWYYEQLELGFNYRMTDMQAALGLSQLTRLDEFIARRQEIAQIYDEAFGDAPLIRPKVQTGVKSAFHLYVVQVNSDRTSLARADLFQQLRSVGIGVNVHYIPVYLQPYYRRIGFRPGLCPEAERYYARAISLPMYAALSEHDRNHVIRAVRDKVRQERKQDSYRA